MSDYDLVAKAPLKLKSPSGIKKKKRKRTRISRRLWNTQA
ncbi:hypothetical protein MRX96_009244 [Rhipicephalus microplus]